MCAILYFYLFSISHKILLFFNEEFTPPEFIANKAIEKTSVLFFNVKEFPFAL